VCKEIRNRIKSVSGGFSSVRIGYLYIGGNAMSTNSSFSKFSRLFFTFAVIPLLFIAGVQLFILSEQTDVYFAWTIPLPFTAAFMGAGYWAALAHAVMIAFKGSWERARASIPAGLVATTFLLATTLLHLDKFHLSSPSFITRFVTWVWIIVYIVTPPVFLYFFVIQLRTARNANGSQNPFVSWVRGGLFVLATFGLLSGIGLFFFPNSLIPLWPWPLMPLASRAVGTWMATFGVAAVTLALQNDRANSTGTMTSLLAFCILQFIVILRYSPSLDFANPLAWGYLLFLLIGVVVSGAGLLNSSPLVE
jgi:hypothetical protein